MIDRYNYRRVESIDDQVENGAALREGLAGLEVLAAGKFPLGEVEVNEEISTLVQNGEYLSGFEFYTNGAMNLFVRRINEGYAHAVIRVRP